MNILISIFDAGEVIRYLLAFLFVLLAVSSATSALKLIHMDMVVRRKYRQRRNYYAAFAKAYNDERERLRIVAEEAEKKRKAILSAVQ